MTTPPKSAYEKAGGMAYFPRMLDKMRLFTQGQLRPDFHANLGKGADDRCVKFLRVTYAGLKDRVFQGGSDEDILNWCFEHGRPLDGDDLVVWNHFITKLGWNDIMTPRLEQLKAEGGLAGRTEIATMVEYFEYDEGRKR